MEGNTELTIPSETQNDEMLRLLRDIHKAFCQQEPKEPRAARKKFRHIVLELMEPGQIYIAENFVEGLLARDVETTVGGINNALIKLCADGEIVRVRSSVYQLPDAD